MNRRALLLILAAPWPAATQKKKGPKPAQLEVIEIAARRVDGGIVEFDGRVRNCGDKPIQNLILVFHILAPDKQVISTQKGAAEEEILEPGEESELHWQMRDHARAVQFEVAAVDRTGNELRVVRAGPFPIQ